MDRIRIHWVVGGKGETRICTNFFTTEPMIGRRQPKLGWPKNTDSTVEWSDYCPSVSTAEGGKADEPKSEDQILNREIRQLREQRRGSSLFAVSTAISARVAFAPVKFELTMAPT